MSQLSQHPIASVPEFISVLRSDDFSFIEVLESSAFQRAVSMDQSFYKVLPIDLRWKLLYGIWSVLLDFSQPDLDEWAPGQQAISFLPASFSMSLEQLLQALCCADFRISRISWSEEFGRDLSDLEDQACDCSFDSVEAIDFVNSLVESGLSLLLACDFATESMSAGPRKTGVVRRFFLWVRSVLSDKPPALS